jgi:acetoacetate decarboxylase
MARVRWAKTLEQLKAEAERRPERLGSRVRSLRLVYETDAARLAAVIPHPLEPAARPEVCVTISHVAMRLGPDLVVEIGSGVVGARARYDGVEGQWVLSMPMTAEPAVVGGRETYGEPKKLARVDFRCEEDEVSAAVNRMGVTFLEVRGRLGEELGPRTFIEHAWCVKAQPSCDAARTGRRFDADPLLVRLDWRHRHDRVRAVDGVLRLGESPFDPVADLPVRRLVRIEYEEGDTESDGHVVRTLPEAWVLPVFHQRYDDPRAEGVEVPEPDVAQAGRRSSTTAATEST